MCTQGETFYYDINDEEYQLHVLKSITIEEEEYFITEDFNRKIYVFKYDEEEDDIELVIDKREAQDVIEYWKDEYSIENEDDDLSDYEDDEYYDREDKKIDCNYYGEYDDNYDKDEY
ncbi:MAG: hypothetical protein ACRC6K_07695 [Fusobacteriaceae bacterium]